MGSKNSQTTPTTTSTAPNTPNHWAPQTRKRHRQEHRPQRPTERSDPTQHAKGRTGDCRGPRKETTTRRNVTQGGSDVVERPYTAGEAPPPPPRPKGPSRERTKFTNTGNLVRPFLVPTLLGPPPTPFWCSPAPLPAAPRGSLRQCVGPVGSSRGSSTHAPLGQWVSEAWRAISDDELPSALCSMAQGCPELFFFCFKVRTARGLSLAGFGSPTAVGA